MVHHAIQQKLSGGGVATAYLAQLLPSPIIQAMDGRLDKEKLYEMRFRINRPVSVNYGGKYFFLGADGLSTEKHNKAFCATNDVLKYIADKATERSMYAVASQLASGFITVRGGLRLGIAGQIISDGQSVRTIKNISSLNIRVPHEVKFCSQIAANYIFGSGKNVHNALIVSPPGGGKTTFLRDLAFIAGLKMPLSNILIVDERNEIAACHEGEPQLDVGLCADIYTDCTKRFAFESGIRGMRPDIIITDEIATKEDAEALLYAMSCGVKVIASVHAKDCRELDDKDGWSKLIKSRLITRYICISDRNGPGTYEGVFDEGLNSIN